VNEIFYSLCCIACGLKGEYFYSFNHEFQLLKKKSLDLSQVFGFKQAIYIYTWAPHLLCTTSDIQPFSFFLIMFPFGFQYLIIIYINFKFNLNCIKHYIHGE